MSSLRHHALGAALGLTFALTFALALSTAILPTKGYAYTDEEQQACTPDAMRLCGAYIPDVDRITACMVQNRSQLSPECGRFFRRGPAPGEAAAARPVRKPVHIKPAVAKKPKAKKKAKPATT
jgi:hypothetical protein